MKPISSRCKLGRMLKRAPHQPHPYRLTRLALHTQKHALERMRWQERFWSTLSIDIWHRVRVIVHIR